MKTLIKLLSIIVVAMVVFTGCVQDNPTPDASPTPKATAQPTPIPSPADYKVGDTITIGDWEIKVKSFEAKEYLEDPAEPENREKFTLPALGYFFLVHVEVTNNGSAKKAFCSPSDAFRLNLYYDEFNSYLADASLSSSYEGNLFNAEVDPSVTKEGFIPFTLPAGAATSGKLKLQFNEGDVTLGILDASEFTWNTPAPTESPSTND